MFPAPPTRTSCVFAPPRPTDRVSLYQSQERLKPGRVVLRSTAQVRTRGRRAFRGRARDSKPFRKRPARAISFFGRRLFRITDSQIAIAPLTRHLFPSKQQGTIASITPTKRVRCSCDGAGPGTFLKDGIQHAAPTPIRRSMLFFFFRRTPKK